MDYNSAIEFIFGRLNYEKSPGLAKSLQDFKLMRMVHLLEELGNPQLTIPTVHIAGSKGKGSTSTMVARVLEQAGNRVGLFTSPHVTNYEERFTVNSVRPSNTQIVAYVEKLLPIVQKMDRSAKHRGPTFFEISTAIGWLHFQSEAVDIAVIEVGLGGRLDSTNICRPLVTAITSISLDHTQLLGDTEELIAAEKAGIIKSGIPVVCGGISPGPRQVIHQIAEKLEAPLYQQDREFESVGRVISKFPYREPPRYEFDYLVKNAADLSSLHRLELTMPGEHQVRNAGIAVTILQILSQLGFSVTDTDFRTGLKKAKCPLRIEIISHNPLLIIDAAHNSASINALCETLEQVQATRKRAVVAFSKDKDVPVLLKRLNKYFDEFYLTIYNNPRAVTQSELVRLAGEHLTKEWKFYSASTEALSAALGAAAQTDLICVTGSFFLAAEVQEQLQME